ncbi:MAG TPA: ring-cleaving dioxygenase [Cytophagales bacterium]|nr:ring-cleaving dioxygenase [Cytophagales bacterium]HAP63093.1 ring-cleaving dioxygenase [Cytophagales bacterium]
MSTNATTQTGLITGLHHVTAISSSAAKNVEFYAGILGLRMVKKTVNFDAPDVYHLYYGDELGNPGSIMTFFPFGQNIRSGRGGKGQSTYTQFSIPVDAVSYWVDRLGKFGVAIEKPFERLGETVIQFRDFDGLGLELVATDRDDRPGFSYGDIPLDKSIRGFFGSTMSVGKHEFTYDLLTKYMDYRLEEESENRYRLSVDGTPGTYVDLVDDPKEEHAREGGGTVHHVAFATPTDASQLEIRELLMKQGFHPTQVIDRQYFHSIYFREPNGILFEVATNPPGFSVDEAVEELGTNLKLPAQYEAYREKLEGILEPISPPDFVKA